MSAALPFLPSRGLTRVIARPTFPLKVTVLDDSAGRPHSCRSRGTLVVRRCPAVDTPFVGVSPKDLAAPVPAGAVLSSGQSYSRVCFRLQAVGRRAPVPRAFRSLPHLPALSQWSEETTEGFEGVQKAFAGGANV